MKLKLALAAGAAVGYVLGTKAGRERYEQIKKTSANVWNDPRVQEQWRGAEEAAADLAREAGTTVKDTASQVQDAVKNSGTTDDSRNRP